METPTETLAILELPSLQHQYTAVYLIDYFGVLKGHTAITAYVKSTVGLSKGLPGI